MIIHFKHKGLKALFETGNTKGVNPEHVERLRSILARLDSSCTPYDMRLPKLNLHKLKGTLKEHYAIFVSGNWRITFKFEDQNVIDVNYLDYH
jgi:proteic killer suppression protein